MSNKVDTGTDPSGISGHTIKCGSWRVRTLVLTSDYLSQPFPIPLHGMSNEREVYRNQHPIPHIAQFSSSANTPCGNQPPGTQYTFC
jgi:hypothetical protein